MYSSLDYISRLFTQTFPFHPRREESVEVEKGDVARDRDTDGTKRVKGFCGCGETTLNPREQAREDKASLLSKITFSWLSPLLQYGSQHPLREEDCPPVREDESSSVNYDKFIKYWDPTNGGNFAYALYKAFGPPFLMGGLLKLVHDCCQLAKPQVLKRLIDFIQCSDGTTLDEGFYLSAAIFGLSFVQSVCLRNYFFINYRTGMVLRSAAITKVFRKNLLLSSSARANYGSGVIVNFVSVDATRLQDLTTYLHTVWSGLLQIVVCIYFLYLEVNVAALGGTAVILIMIPVARYLSKFTKAAKEEIQKTRDKRIKWASEAILGMKSIKMQGWESSVLKQINDLRAEEVRKINYAYVLETISEALWYCTPIFVAIATFALYIGLGNELNVQIIFTSLALFDILRFPLNVFPNVINDIINANVTASRLSKFLTSEEVESITAGDLVRPGVSVKNGSFRWESTTSITSDSTTDLSATSSGFRMKDINLDLTEGPCLVGVIGRIGSGKSSLLNIILSEMKREGGSVNVRGSIAYVPQQPFILNCSVRDNILFGKVYDESRYISVLHACALSPDLAALPHKDLTQIGEKGINLSGGQKARIALARAVYQEADVILLDDVLSAVDKHVARHIMEHVIAGSGLLRGKVCLFVTNAMEYLRVMDRVIVIDDGTIMEEAPYKNLNSAAFRSLNEAYGQNESEVSVKRSKSSSSSPSKIPPTAGTMPVPSDDSSIDAEKVKLRSLLSESNVSIKEREKRAEEEKVLSEERLTGNIEWSVYSSYMTLASGSVVLFLLIASLFLINQGLTVFSEYWLSQLTTHQTLVWYYLDTYFIISSVIVVVFFLMIWAVFRLCVVASRQLHQKLVGTLIRAPMSFFDITPSGRLMNRISKDIAVCDDELPATIIQFLETGGTTVVVVGTIIIVTPLFVAVLLPLLVMYYWSQKYFVKTQRELKRLESNSRSPVFSLFAETIDGATVIRSSGNVDRFIHQNYQKLDANMGFWILLQAANCWLGERLEMVGAIISFGSAFFCVLQLTEKHGDPSFAALAGLSISLALSVTQSLNWLVRMNAQQETEIISVERILQYCKVDVERAAIVPSHRPPRGWPQRGGIVLSNVSMRYRSNLPRVLNRLSLSIEPGMKVGVCGRTGAGKSSVILALLRLVELDEGSITIDGLDISQIGLDDLRNNIAVISQDPVLFSGTVRFNLDPFDAYTDATLYSVLERVKLTSFIENLDKGLYAIVAERGSNFSIGQRQLLCIARSLLKQTKVFLLDEATSNCDSVSDQDVQMTLRNECKGSTVITIAHRIHTIMDSDMILVLSDGAVKEFQPPSVLLKDPNSLFYSLVHASSELE